MEKSQSTAKDISYVLDTRTIPNSGLTLKLTATPEECTELAKRFELPAVNNLSCQLNLEKKEDIIQLKGLLSAHIIQECVVTLEPFENILSGEFVLLFSTTPQPHISESIPDIDMEEEPVEFLPRGQLFFKEIIAEQFGLNINPFPKQTTELFEYREVSSEDIRETPFSILKHLTKE
ncbi:MAG: hypothetical protein IKZ02_05280 [Alphaproteobacteria bacterium]|nr:hypothetical protein [Alphaproteobacteria bacterium]